MNRITTIAAAAVLASGNVHAADEVGAPSAADATVSDTRLLEEIIVTARRTQESLQDVPISMMVMDANALQREQINSAQDLQGRVPSLSIGANGQMRNTQTPTIRGQGTTYGASPGVVIYYGEVPLPSDFPGSAQGGPGKFFDVSNLQILKGAQGTLFGRNTTGGALVVEPHQPEDEFGASLATDVTSYSGRRYEAIINTPVVEEKLLMRAGFQKFERDGFTKDIASGKELDDQNYWTGRLGFTWRLSDEIENYLLGYYTHSDDNGTGLVIEGINGEVMNEGLNSILGRTGNFGCDSFNSAANSTNCGQDLVAEQDARGNRKTELSLTPFDEIKTSGVIDQFSVELTDSMTLRNIISYSKFKHSFNWDADGSRALLQDLAESDGYSAYNINQTTEELQLKGSAMDDRLDYVVGGYYQHNRPEGPMGQHISALNFTLPTADFKIEQESYAPYAQGTYTFDSGLNLTIGVRYTTDKIDGSSGAGGVFHEAELKSEAATYTVGLDYKTESNLIYGKISRGYKSGGFSATAVTPELYTYDPEYVLNYEIGQKSDFSIGDVPARFNTSIYYTDYSDMQRGGIDKGAGFNLGSAIFTAGSASIMGVEVDAMAEPYEGLRFSLNYAYTHAEYDDFTIKVNGLSPQLDCNGDWIPQGGYVDLACAPFQYTPKHQVSLTTSYDIPVPQEVGAVDVSVTYAWVDDQYSSSYSLPEAEPGAWIDSYGLLNASVSWWGIYGSNFDVSIYGTNLTDKEYRISNSNVWNLNYFKASIYGEPRIVGARLAYSFD